MQLCGADIEDYAKWSVEGKDVSSASTYRIAWRRMAATTGFRTLYPALIPPGAAHVHTVNSAALPEDSRELVRAGAYSSSFLTDFRVRAGGASEIQSSQYELLPIGGSAPSDEFLIYLYLRLNCLTSAYAPLWEELTREKWTEDTPLRNAKERFHAQNSIDAIVAFSLGVTVNELCMIYRTQFPVMRRYDQENHFDSRGRKVPKEVLKAQLKLGEGDSLPEGDRTWVHPQSGVSYTFEYPFVLLDREADLKSAYAQLEPR